MPRLFVALTKPPLTLAALILLLTACSGDDGTDGAVGPSGSDGLNSLIVQTPLAEGDERCEAGGFEVQSGIDADGDGVLAADEVDATSVSCNAVVASADLPNILLVVADDVGVDQLASFGFGGIDPPAVPTIDSLANDGVRFANTWSMPTCSATRVALMTGKYPTRTNVNTAIVSVDLANSQMSPYENSLPNVLARSGYVNGYVGKIHASGSDVNPANYPLGDETMVRLGWDYFAGYLDGGPRPIDVRAGLSNLADDAAPFTCGFIPKSSQHPLGADSGACYTADGACAEIGNNEQSSAGKRCLDAGGILDPNQSCAAEAPAYVDFSRHNAYYTAELIEADRLGARRVAVDDVRTRKHRTALETDLAINWLQQQTSDRPWMLTVGFSAAHAPLQPVPDDMIPGAEPLSSGIDCTETRDVRPLMDQNVSAIDAEFGRLLEAAGVMIRGTDGGLRYDPASNTVVAFVGDNGSLGTTVKAPFSLLRAKATVYQGGIWIPMLVTAPNIDMPGRRIDALTNIIDLYALFTHLGGQELTAEAAQRHDVAPLMPYLKSANTPPQRSINFSYSGRNIQNETPAPCVINDLSICLQLFPQAGVCASEGGDWYGEGGVVAGQSFDSCCAVNAYFASTGQPEVDILSETQAAIRNDAYKLMSLRGPDCAAGGALVTTEEFYQLTAGTDDPTANLDNLAVNDLLAANGVAGLSPEALDNYEQLQAQLQVVLSGEADCPGDGNLDRIVDDNDLDNWAFWASSNDGQSSWYDFNLDGVTDEADRQVIEANLGLSCGL